MSARVPYCVDAISLQTTVKLQAQSQEEMALWLQVIQNANAANRGGVGVRRVRAHAALCRVWTGGAEADRGPLGDLSATPTRCPSVWLSLVWLGLRM